MGSELARRVACHSIPPPLDNARWLACLGDAHVRTLSESTLSWLQLFVGANDTGMVMHTDRLVANVWSLQHQGYKRFVFCEPEDPTGTEESGAQDAAAVAAACADEDLVDDEHWRDDALGDGLTSCARLTLADEDERARLCGTLGEYSEEVRHSCPCACRYEEDNEEGGGPQQQRAPQAAAAEDVDAFAPHRWPATFEPRRCTQVLAGPGDLVHWPSKWQHQTRNEGATLSVGVSSFSLGRDLLEPFLRAVGQHFEDLATTSHGRGMLQAMRACAPLLPGTVEVKGMA